MAFHILTEFKKVYRSKGKGRGKRVKWVPKYTRIGLAPVAKEKSHAS